MVEVFFVYNVWKIGVGFGIVGEYVFVGDFEEFDKSRYEVFVDENIVLGYVDLIGVLGFVLEEFFGC